MNFTVPFSFRTSIRSSLGDRVVETESCSTAIAFLCKVSNGSQSSRSVEEPIYVFGISKPSLCFFHPKRNPVTDIKKKKMNNAAPVYRCIFLKILKSRACFILLFGLVIVNLNAFFQNHLTLFFTAVDFNGNN